MAMKTGLKMNGDVVTRAVGLRSVSADFVVAAALASGGALSFGLLAEWPVWLIGLVTLLPWVPVFVAETLWSYRHYPWLALFYNLLETAPLLISFAWQLARTAQSVGEPASVR